MFCPLPFHPPSSAGIVFSIPGEKFKVFLAGESGTPGIGDTLIRINATLSG